jgi:hypothetical protein
VKRPSKWLRWVRKRRPVPYYFIFLKSATVVLIKQRSVLKKRENGGKVLNFKKPSPSPRNRKNRIKF